MGTDKGSPGCINPNDMGHPDQAIGMRMRSCWAQFKSATWCGLLMEGLLRTSTRVRSTHIFTRIC